MAAIKTSIIRIGNSQGIRIPKSLLKQCRLSGEVELISGESHLVVRSVTNPRVGWDQLFEAAADKQSDANKTGFGHIVNRWDREEWEW